MSDTKVALANTDSPITRRVFVDFMYAIVVGSVLPLVNDKHLHWGDPTFYTTAFLIVVVLEDYFLYETQIARYQKALTFSVTGLLGLILEIFILICWYLSAVSVPEHPLWFLSSFASFYALKFAAGWAHWKAIRWESMRNFAFTLPIAVCGWIWFCGKPEGVGAWVVVKLAASWIAMLAVWWGVTIRHMPSRA